MAIIADYLVIGKPAFRLQLGATALPARPEMSFTFTLPAGTVLLRGEPLLHYNMVLLNTPGTGNQMGISVQVNGTEVHKKLFLEGSREVLVEAILNPAPFTLAGQNTIRFKPVSPTNDTTHSIIFESVVLWFQRDSAAQG